MKGRALKSLGLRRVALAGLWALLLLLPQAASASPVVTFKTRLMPIAGFRHTGNILGAGAAVQSEFNISGTEYSGFPPPLVGINLYLPASLVVHSRGFPTCPLSTLERMGAGPKQCPKGSQAGPVGVVHGQVAFGRKMVPETATLESFYAQGGGLEFFTFGPSPAVLEIVSTAHYVSADGLFGRELISQIPLVETVYGAQDYVIEGLSFKVGSAVKRKGKTTYYYTVPSKCPKGGFPVRSELVFAKVESQVVTKTYKMSCPHVRA